MAESELFSFNTGGKKPSFRQLAAADKLSSKVPSQVHTLSSDSEDGSSSGSYYSDDDGGTKRRRRKRKSHTRRFHHSTGGKESSIASRLMHNQPITVVLDDSDDDLTSPSKKSKSDANNGRGRSSSPSPSLSPSPQPSPPPPYAMLSASSDKKSRKTLDKANNVLNMLRWSSPSAASFSDSYSDNSFLFETPPPTAGRTLTLRVRCKGKVHKFDVYKGDPLSSMCSQLAKKVGAENGDQLLLSYKNSTLRKTESPATLGLSTADIIDAVVMTKDSLLSTSDAGVACERSSSGGPSITIKVQSSDKSIVYSLSKTDPLQKAMTAFASSLGVSMTKLRFMFDGDPIKPTQTAADLDMENDDCIDVRII